MSAFKKWVFYASLILFALICFQVVIPQIKNFVSPSKVTGF